MTRNLAAVVLIVALAISAVCTGVLAVVYSNNVGDLRELQRQANQVNQIGNKHALARALAADALEYSKRNPAIDPVLQSMGIKPQAQPAAKPAK